MWPPRFSAAARTVPRISATTSLRSRKQMCSAHGMVTSTRSPCSAARSSSQRGGTVKVRSVLAPSSVISRKSVSTTFSAGKGKPCDDTPNGP